MSEKIFRMMLSLGGVSLSDGAVCLVMESCVTRAGEAKGVKGARQGRGIEEKRVIEDERKRGRNNAFER